MNLVEVGVVGDVNLIWRKHHGNLFETNLQSGWALAISGLCSSLLWPTSIIIMSSEYSESFSYSYWIHYLLWKFATLQSLDEYTRMIIMKFKVTQNLKKFYQNLLADYFSSFAETLSRADRLKCYILVKIYFIALLLIVSMATLKPF